MHDEMISTITSVIWHYCFCVVNSYSKLVPGNVYTCNDFQMIWRVLISANALELHLSCSNPWYHLGIKVTNKITANVIGGSVGCFTNVSQALQNNLSKINNAINHIYGENFKLKLYTCVQSMALGTCTKFQFEILTRSMISAIHTFWENILESSQNVSETTPRYLSSLVHIQGVYLPSHMTSIPSKHFAVTKIRGHIVLRFGRLFSRCLTNYMDYMDLAVHWLRKAIKLNHSLTNCIVIVKLLKQNLPDLTQCKVWN